MPSLRESMPLSRKKIAKKMIPGVLPIFIVIILIVASAYQAANISLWTSILLLTVLFLMLSGVNYLYQKSYYDRYFYDIRDGFLTIKKGVVLPRETTMPLEKINDVYMDQDPLDRAFSIYDVHFSTATIQSGLQAHIDGLAKNNAGRLRDVVLKAIKEA